MLIVGEGSFLDVLVQLDGSTGRVGNGAGTADAAAGAAHAFQQIAVVLAGLGQHQQLLALGQTLCGCDLHIHVGVPLLDLVGNGLGHAAGLGKAAACSGRKKNLSMTCLRKLLYFFTNKNQFIKSNSSNKNDYIIKKQKKTAFIAVF